MDRPVTPIERGVAEEVRCRNVNCVALRAYRGMGYTRLLVHPDTYRTWLPHLVEHHNFHPPVTQKESAT